MERIRWRICLALAALIGLGLVTPARAGDQVPFAGTIYPVIVSQTVRPDGKVALVLRVSGNATHLGRFAEGVAWALLDPATLKYTGSFYWPSPNGRDSLSGVFKGRFLPTADPCVVGNREKFWITGGAGSFANATGGGEFDEERGWFNLCDNEGDLPFAGTISRPYSP